MHLINWSLSSVSTSVNAEVLEDCWSGAFRCVNTNVAFFPGVDTPANSPQDQPMQCSEKLQTRQTATSQTLISRIIKFMTVQLENDWTSMASLDGLPEKSRFSLKSRWHLKNPQDPWNNVRCIPKYSRVRCKAICGLAVIQYHNNQQSTAANLQQRGDRRADRRKHPP